MKYKRICMLLDQEINEKVYRYVSSSKSYKKINYYVM